MAIAGFGVDIVDVNRIKGLREKYGEKFLKKVFTELEIKTCMRTKRPDEMLAARFAAKEAVMKALRAGVYSGVHFKDIEISGGVDTAPIIRLHERAMRAAIEAGAIKVFVSLSHERNYAVAMIVIED